MAEAAEAAVAAAEAGRSSADRAMQEAAAAADEARRRRAAADRLRTEAHAKHTAASLTVGMRPGDPCPVCGHPLDLLPERTEQHEVDSADKAYQLSLSGETNANSAWARSEKELSAAVERLVAAERDLVRMQGEVVEWEAERTSTAAALREVFGEQLPAEAVAALDDRAGRVRALLEAESTAQEVLREAEDGAAVARRALEAGRVVGAELVGRLRALGIAPLLQRTRKAVPDLEGSTALTEALPGDAGEAAVAARHICEGSAEMAGRVSAHADTIRDGLVALLATAVEAMPDDVEVAGRPSDPDELLEVVRRASLDQAALAAAARRDAEVMAERLAERIRLEKEIDGLRAEATLLRSLAEELRADRLITFLQSEALELLATAGSERLLFLSQGRYRMVFEDDEFSVEDRLNGDERRSVRTLSGGETFLASLALALALSEQHRSLAVTDRAPLESLFIDEGFGSLDPESLEIATEALGQLGGEDRMVGVVTHVRELAERMPVRIDVRKEGRTSTIEVA
jgi:exonuclease SbcC